MGVFKIAVKNIKFVMSNLFIVPAVILFHIIQFVVSKNAYENFMGTYDNGLPQFAVIEILNGQKSINALHFYSAATLTQLVLTLSIVAASLIASDFENNTIQRVLVSPVRKISIIIGNFIGYFAVTLFIAISYVVLVYFLFGFKWGEAYFGMFVTTLILAFTGTSLSIFLSGIFKSVKIAASVSAFLVVIMAFSSGGISAGMQFNAISKFTVNRWAFDAYMNCLDGQPIAYNAQSYLILFLIGFLLLGAATILFMRRKIYE
ncbi:MAG: ABC transporter permease [Clostridia bacterium]|nr:ABC transporter permease [Clostridia bacterium]